MSTISTAVSLERESRVNGYKIKKGFFDVVTPNLPQIVAIFGEANMANQTDLDTNPYEFTSAQEVGELYGYGSPLHQMARILRPNNNDGIGGIPTVVFPQLSDAAAIPSTRTWTVTGTATENATHTVVINGREDVDFVPYDFVVVKDDTAQQVVNKIVLAISAVLGAPVTALAGSNGEFTITTKWAGETSDKLKVRINVNNKPAGLSYSQTGTTSGAGAVNLAKAFTDLGQSVWYTSVINPYGVSKLDEFEQINGIPDPENPTGRYQGLIFRPFNAYFGSTLDDKDDLAVITDNPARVGQVTNVICPVPRSEVFEWEAAASWVRVSARIMQDTPELDVNGQVLPDIPAPEGGLIGDMSVYSNRDFLLKKGCSTVIYENGNYVIQDSVTTYHISGERPLQYRYTRNLNIDRNVAFAYQALENRFVKDRVLVKDNQVTDVSKSIKPKEWKAILFELFDDLGVRALINEPEFSKKSLRVLISEINPSRLESFLRYKRTEVARIQSTTVEAGF